MCIFSPGFGLQSGEETSIEKNVGTFACRAKDGTDAAGVAVGGYWGMIKRKGLGAVLD